MLLVIIKKFPFVFTIFCEQSTVHVQKIFVLEFHKWWKDV